MESISSGAQTEARAATQPDRCAGINNDPTTMIHFPPEMLSEERCFIYICVSAWQQRSARVPCNKCAGEDAFHSHKWSGGGGEVMQGPQCERLKAPYEWGKPSRRWRRSWNGLCGGQTLLFAPSGNLWLCNVGNSVLCTCCYGRTPKRYNIKGSAQPLTAFVWHEMKLYILTIYQKKRMRDESRIQIQNN